MPVRPSRLRALACLLLMTSSAARAAKVQTSGAFMDRTGKQHTWAINASHALLWDGQPYIPVGGLFCPRYLAQAPTDENWQQDAAALDRLKAKGLTDLIVSPVVSAADVPAAAWQRVVDALEAGGFRYGIAFGAGVPTPLSGTVVKPSAYRREDVRDGMELTWELPDADRAAYVVVDAKDPTRVATQGAARAFSGRLSIQPTTRAGEGMVALIYPRRTIAPSRDGYLPDLWQGFDAYRDKLLTTLGAVKFGPGLRFFLDPLAKPLGISGETEYQFPDSPGFRAEWEFFLKRRYPALDDLMSAWGVEQRDLKDMRQAARLLPMWANGRGIPFLMDPDTTKLYACRAGDGTIWRDFRQFRSDSIGYYLRTAADVLKREVANVPVIYTRTQQHAFFTNGEAGGFDGLGMAAFGRGSSLVTSGPDSTYMQCEQASRTMWCPVTEMAPLQPKPQEAPGYQTRDTMFADLDWLRSIGAKGFFLTGYQVLPESDPHSLQLLRSPEQLGWLGEYATRAGKDTGVAALHPRVLSFPYEAAGLVHAGPMASGVWWVPSPAEGRALVFADSYAGYTINDAAGQSVVLWSLRGARETRLQVDDPRGVTIETPDGTPVRFKADKKKHLITVAMDGNPVVIRAGGQDVFPVNATDDVLLELRTLVADGLIGGMPVEQFRLDLDRADAAEKRADSRQAYLLAREALSKVIAVMHPFTWREAETVDRSAAFGETIPSAGASGRAFLQLNSDSAAPSEGYSVQFTFEAPSDGVYSAFVSCAPRGPEASPFAWVIDQGQPRTSAQATAVGEAYLGDQFMWLNLGSTPLRKGPHTFTLRVSDRAAGSGRYKLALDCFVITQLDFRPNGITWPQLPQNPKPMPDPYHGVGKKK